MDPVIYLYNYCSQRKLEFFLTIVLSTSIEKAGLCFELVCLCLSVRPPSVPLTGITFQYRFLEEERYQSNNIYTMKADLQVVIISVQFFLRYHYIRRSLRLKICAIKIPNFQHVLFVD